MKKKQRGTKGAGTVRRRTDGRWEARFTVGINSKTGKEIRKSVYGKTQNEVRKKMTEAIAAVDNGTYKEPSKMTVADWLETWMETYLVHLKPRSKESYESNIKYHLIPGLGKIRLEALNTHTIQTFYNRLTAGTDEKSGLSTKSLRNLHGILHKALNQAVAIGYLRTNPADACELEKVVRKDLEPLDEAGISKFLAAIQGHPFESVFLVALFTGMRQGEILGLTWDRVNFEQGTVLVNKQLQKLPGGGSVYELATTKNRKGRTITPAPDIMDLLREQKVKQAKWQLKAGAEWNNELNLVFTNEKGRHLMHHTVYNNFKEIVASIGYPKTRFHDLRHTYAVAAIQAGDDIKTVQNNLGHSTAALTLDVYAYVTNQMQKDSADRMQKFIDQFKGAS